jgi:hypothetical protein
MDHLINKEICRTTKPEKSAKLTIDNAQLSSNGDIGMNMRDTSHEHLHPLVQSIYQRYHKIYLEDFCFTARSKKLHEKSLKV